MRRLRDRPALAWRIWSRYLMRQAARGRSLLPLLLAETAPLDLRFLGRTLLQAAAVGVAAGLVGAAFFFGIEWMQRLLLEELAGYEPLRAHGESFAAGSGGHVFRPWLLVVLPALGGLACGLLTRLAPETKGGGGDATIDAFHHGGNLRGRVAWVKGVASLMTLGTGGAGGREGPTMQIGGALGTLTAKVLRLGPRERRILLVAGVAAGISAVFRTPLGAALLAVEVLYRDGFESDALVPSVLASVIAYSVVISLYGESTLFAHPGRFPFVPEHLPLYGLMALVVSAAAALFVAILRRTRRAFARSPLPGWSRPMLGGLLLGLFCVPVIYVVGENIGSPGQGLGLLGGGYGAVQMAISGAPWLPVGWIAVGLLVFLSLAKIVAASLTIGSEGSAGDFAPSLAIGGLLGGAFGRAAELLVADPRIDPGAFALIGMGVFYGGVAHVPLAAVVLVCEMAGNYDLLVPLMLAMGVGFVLLRRSSLYETQVPTVADSPAHRDTLLLEALRSVRVREVMDRPRHFVSFEPSTTIAELLRRAHEAPEQEVFPVLDEERRLLGLVNAATVRVLSAEGRVLPWALAADAMQPPISVGPEDDLRAASEILLQNNLREIPVTDAEHRVLGFLDEAEVARVYIRAARRAEAAPGTGH